MIDDVAGAGIVVAGLADAAYADGVAAVRVQGDRIVARFLQGDPFAFLSPDGGDVGVTVETEARGLFVEVIPRQLFVGEVSEGVGLIQGTMNERHVSHGHHERQLRDPLLVTRFEVAMTKRDGRPQFAELVGSELPAIAPTDDEHPFVVAHQVDGGELAHVLDAGGRLGSVADRVAEAEDGEAALGGDVGQDRAERIDVGVDVGDDGDAAC